MRSKLTSLALACLCLACVAAGAKAIDANTKEKASAADVNAKTAGTDTTSAKSSDAQDAKSQLIVPMQSGAFVLIRTESVPSAAHDSTSNLVESEDKPNLIHRIFVDSKNELFF